ncbi:hypothetical protein [Flavobacterium sp. M31R6]|uniref:hypothetical protein n=1 Tax=Flavobacterium sp. M31R6 TaxID=2739062 RepID=UPI00156A115B|nr:hypothetical protein [Flavobacterium sp. M31R6]QKJ63339.1 hypothetical protein HQN62_09400 [Flavobacterium sp. M31R6]
MKQSISTKQILIDLLSIKDQVKKLFENQKEFNSLVTYLCAKDYYNDDNIPFPTLKEIEIGTGLNSNQLRKQLLRIYEDLFNYDPIYNLEFNETEYVFYLNYNKVYGSFTLTKIMNLPRIGENVTIPFLKAKVNTDYFYVDDIRHYFEGNTQRIDIYLLAGSFNSYWYNRKHQAVEENEISFRDLYDLYDFQLKKLLKIGRYKYDR